MILDFADKETESVWRGERSRRLPASNQDIARRKLRMLNNAQTLEDLCIPPANRLEAHQLTERIFAVINMHLAARGLMLREGTVVDATIISAPSSTKNQDGKRDPEMHY